MDRHDHHADASGPPEGKRIAEMAREVGVEPHVLRHWEDEGVLVAGRDALGHRRYSSAQVEVARGIRTAQRHGMSLAVIREFLQGDLTRRGEILHQHHQLTAQQISSLGATLEQIKGRLADPGDESCPYRIR